MLPSFQRFPRVYLSVAEKSESFSSLLHDDLVVVEEAWSPYSLGTDVSSSAKPEYHNKTSGSIDATAFHLLVEDLAKVPDDVTTEKTDLKRLRNMLLFQYLVNVLEGDFIPRNMSFKANSKWTTLRDSLLSMILVSRKINFKGLIKDCLSTLCELSQFSMDSSHDVRPPESGLTDVSERCHAALAIALPEVVKRTCGSVQKLLSMIIELDSSKKAADMDGLTTRADGVRTPGTEIILEELTYDKNILVPFFQALDKPKLKLDMAVQYLQKYIPKTSVRTRRSNGSENDSTFGGILKYFSNGNNTKSIIKKISTEAAQLLLAHAFQAYILLPSQQPTDSSKDIVDNSLSEICNNMVSAFVCLKKTDAHTGILPFGKEALLTAAIMLSRS
ncbi:negative regulator of systemic acquired resistance SNI1 isoform X1 [Tanacetum coccineum]